MSHHLACLYVDDLALLLTHEAAQEIVVVDLSQEADALAILASGTGQLGIDGYLSYLFLHQSAQRKDGVLQLVIGELCQEVGLILDRVNGCSQPHHIVLPDIRGIMAGGNMVVGMSDALLKGSELDKTVAHHVRIGRQSLLDTFHGITDHQIPVFLLQVGHLQVKSILARCSLREFDVLLCRARRVFSLHAYLDIMQVGLDASLAQTVYHDGTVHSARYEYGHATSYFLKFHVLMPLNVCMESVMLSPSAI